MNELVFVNNALISAEPYTTEEIIATYAKVKLKTVRRLINKYKSDLESIGFLRFQISKRFSGSGRPIKDYLLNEQQAMLLITYLSNTEPVREFKKTLVRQFVAMRQELNRREVYKVLEKPVYRSLTDAIKEWEYSNQWSYKAFTDLICKTVTGKNTKQLKKERGCDTKVVGTDIYTSDELAAYKKLETRVISMIDLGMTYQNIKDFVNGKDVKIELPAKKDAKKDLLPPTKVK